MSIINGIDSIALIMSSWKWDTIKIIPEFFKDFDHGSSVSYFFIRKLVHCNLALAKKNRRANYWP